MTNTVQFSRLISWIFIPNNSLLLIPEELNRLINVPNKKPLVECFIFSKNNIVLNLFYFHFSHPFTIKFLQELTWHPCREARLLNIWGGSFLILFVNFVRITSWNEIKKSFESFSVRLNWINWFFYLYFVLGKTAIL